MEKRIMKMALYKVVDRELVFVKWVEVPEAVHDDTWLFENGYSRDHTLRRGKVIEVTPAESRALRREHDRLKASGLLPSALDRIVGKLTN